jgi:hypothetical protein
MSEQNLHTLAAEVEKRYKKKENRKKRKMKVTGAGVKDLAKLIKRKSLE